ncbi:hypothetical protein EIP86_004848 [Pleurotus ostreatoroseus]|nr:hypothetical protein EIP86_004848 [Pleurotus ostreatoroseus]
MDRPHTRSADSSSFHPLDIRSFIFRRTATARAQGTSRRLSPTASTSVPSQRAGRTAAHVQSRLAASTQSLPVEVVLQILAYALPSIYDRATCFRSDSNGFCHAATRDFRRVLRETQLYFHRAALVCRAWYPVANELLYTCPFFTAHDSVAAFGRTLKTVPQLRQFVKEVWFFNEEGKLDPMGFRRKNSRRVQADLSIILRNYTSLTSFIVCNHGLAEQNFPIDNILVYGLPVSPDAPHIPRLTLHGPGAFNEPWSRHAKPANLEPQSLEVLCMRDIETTPSVLKCSPYVPTLPRLHTLQVYMRSRDETPFVSSGTFPGLRSLEVYRDVFDNRRQECMRTIAVDEACLQKLDRLHLIGRTVESALWRAWAEAQVLNSLRHLAIGLLHRREHAFLADWKLPDKLETLLVLVWHDESETSHELGELGHAKSLLTALASCVERNRQHRAFRKLEIKTVAILPDSLAPLVRDVRDKCGYHGFGFELTEAGELSKSINSTHKLISKLGTDRWILQRLG